MQSVTAPETSATWAGLQPGHNLNVVTIVAVDKAGNASAPSNAITVHTNWGSGC